MRTGDREGMILLNVLIVVAVAAAAVAVMISVQDADLRRAQRVRDLAQAAAYVQGGEASAIAALRRDAVQAPDADGLAEPWAAIGQRPITVPGGWFALTIQDDQARFNLNSLAGPDPDAAALFASIGRLAGVDPQNVAELNAGLATLGPIRDETALIALGVDPADLDRLRPWTTVLPVEARLNLNTAAPALVNLALGPALAQTVLSQRRSRALTDQDLRALGAPALTTGRSNHFHVSVEASVGDETRSTVTELTRRYDPQGVSVVVTGRKRQEVVSPAAPSD